LTETNSLTHIQEEAQHLFTNEKPQLFPLIPETSQAYLASSIEKRQCL